MKPIIAWFANNHVAANLLMGLIILAGFVSLPTMPMKPFPDIDVPLISITVPYLGAAPEEVEEGVCMRGSRKTSRALRGSSISAQMPARVSAPCLLSCSKMPTNRRH